LVSVAVVVGYATTYVPHGEGNAGGKFPWGNEADIFIIANLRGKRAILLGEERNF